MTDRSFRTAMRGYDPLQVDRALAECDDQLAAVAARLPTKAEAQVVTLTEHVGVIEGGARQSSGGGPLGQGGARGLRGCRARAGHLHPPGGARGPDPGTGRARGRGGPQP